MINPMDALSSLQEQIYKGIPLRSSAAHPELKMFMDQPDGRLRFTFARVDSDTIKAFASFIMTKPVNGLPCISASYAVPSEFRKQGLATETVAMALQHIKFELQGFGVSQFYVEATTDIEDVASQKVASKTLTSEFKTITDETSGKEAYYYCHSMACR